MLKIKISAENVLQKQNLDILKLFIENDENDINIKDIEDRSLLHLAIGNNCSKDIVQYLIQNGANLNAEDKNGKTPLHYAAEAGKLEIIQLLLEHKANLNFTDGNNATPLCTAVQTNSNNIEVIKFLLDRSCTNNNKKALISQTFGHLINSPLKTWNIENIQFLIRLGADINERHNLKKTLLHEAASYADVDFIKFLLEYGADINATDKFGRTPLHCAVGTLKYIFQSDNKRKDKEDICKILYKFGANINLRDNKDRTPLFLAVLYNDEMLVEYFLNKGSDAYCTLKLIDILKRQQELAADIVVKRLAKLDALNLINHENYLIWKSIASFEVKTFQDYCLEEVNKMTNEIICSNRIIKFADVLTKPAQTVSSYLNLDDVEQALQNVNFEENFPMFADLFKLKIQKAKKYRPSSEN